MPIASWNTARRRSVVAGLPPLTLSVVNGDIKGDFGGTG